jgi:hypothetical protein
MKPKPKPMRIGPKGLPALFNALRDFVLADRIIPGPGLSIDETVDGRVLGVDDAIIAAAAKAAGLQTTNNPPGTATNPGISPPGTGGTGGPGTGGGGGPDGGTGLPGVETDPETGEPTLDGDPLAWQTLNVCIDDGDGGYTPATMKVYGTTPTAS